MEEQDRHKALIGFKCSPALRLSLCEQAERVGVTLSSFVETIVSSYKNKDEQIKELSALVKSLQGRIDFYEAPFLKDLYDRYKGQAVRFNDREGSAMTITIDDIQDVYTIIINSFKADK